MSSPQNDAADAGRIIPVIPDAPESASPQPDPGDRVPLTSDPLNTLKLKPLVTVASTKGDAQQ